jgi:hypothetical protein
MQIKEVKTREEVVKTFHFLAQTYENLEENSYILSVMKMLENGYKMIAVFSAQNQEIIAVSGFRIIDKIQYGKTLEIEDFAIDKNTEAGKILIQFVQNYAATFGCRNIIGNLATKRVESQKIFTSEKFFLDEFLFRKIL